MLTWHGVTLYADVTRWTVTVKPAGDGTVADPTVPAADLAAFLNARGLGIRFVQYLGTRWTFSIRVPEGVAPEALEAAVSKLPGFQFLDPNVIPSVLPTSAG